jgi:hypothetical protein
MRTRLQHVSERLLKLFLLAIMLLALVPFGSPDVKMDNLGDLNVDVAFQLALPYFLDQRLQFGEQVIFTYGPWGILISTFTGSTWNIVALLFRTALAASTFMAICVLASRHTNQRNSLFVLSGGLAIILLWITGHKDSYYIFPSLLVAYQRWALLIAENENFSFTIPRKEKILWIVLSLLSGWLALAKFNIFAVSTVAFFLILSNDVRRKQWPVLPFSFIAALLTAWLVAGQKLANLPLWIFRCLDLSNGYADAMAKGFFIPYGAGQVAIYYGAVFFVMLAAFVAAAVHRWTLPAVLSLLLSLFLCGISVKHGMGGNQVEQSLALLVTVIWFLSQLLLIQTTPEAGPWKYLRCKFGFATTLIALVCFIVFATGVNFPIVNLKNALADVRSNAYQLVKVLQGNSTGSQNEVLLKAHHFWQPGAQQGNQTIDVYSQHTGVVMGREGLHYTPRPAFLSLNAHTFKLAMLNADHLEESTAPDLILFQVLPRERSVNNRHPALADGPSWPLLLSKYALENAGKEFLLLKKRPQPLRIERKLLLDLNLRMGERVLLPEVEGNLLWAEVEVQRSPVGNLVHMLYKSPQVLLESLTTQPMESHLFQIVPELGKAGFLISPLVQNNATFAELYQGHDVSSDVVQSIVIASPEAPDYFWKETIRLKVWVLSFH